MKPRKVRVRLAIAGLGSALALGVDLNATAAAPNPSRPQGAGAPLIYQKSRSFRVPFHFDPAERARRRELQLWVSDDLGRTWSQQGVTTPERPAFNFRCARDGEFWLAVRTVDAEGRLHPADSARIEPSMKVVVDTTPPSVVLEKQVRSTSLASVRWEIRDDFPDQKAPLLEYQVEGSTEWRPVPNDASGTLGVATWDAGYAEPLKVRATIVDRAGNRGQTIIDVPSCTVAAPALAANDSTPTPAVASSPEPAPSAVEAQKPTPGPAIATAEGAPNGLPPTGSEGQPRRVPEHAPVFLPSEPGLQTASAAPIERLDGVPPAAGTGPGTTALPPIPGDVAQAAPVATNPLYASPMPDHSTVQAGRPGTAVAAPAMATTQGVSPSDPMNPEDLPVHRLAPVGADPHVDQARMVAEPSRTPSAEVKDIPTVKVQARKFALDYAIDGRPDVIELWLTRDGGKTWAQRGIDADRASPVQIELDGEGRFGLSLIARDIRGLGDRPPAPGDLPQMWIEVAPQLQPQPQAARRSPSLLQRAFRR